MNTPRVASLLAACALAGVLAAAPAPASAASKRATDCPVTRGTLAVSPHGFGRVWHQGTSLYACTTVYGHRPRARRMGPWAPGTRVSFDGVDLAWTVPMVIDGRGTDRVWAGNADSGKRWMLAQKPNPGGATKPSREGRVQRIVAVDRSVAWVTKGGAVVGALEEVAGTPAVVGPLPGAPVVQKNLVLMGTWPAASAAALGATLKIAEEDGDGDECGGVNPYVMTVRPDPATPPAGVRWDGYWTSTNCE